MRRRIFIAIELPPDLKQQVSETIAQWRWLPIRWLAPENWHVTLIPPVYMEDGEVGYLTTLFGRGRFGKPFPVRFSRVVLAPPGVQARMIWLEGDAPPELAQLRKKLEKLWASGPVLPPLKPETRPAVSRVERPLTLHVTLARFEPGELKELESKTRTLGEVNFRFEANEIVVMESRLKPSGAEYERLVSVPFAA